MYGLPVVDITGKTLENLLAALDKARGDAGGIETLSVCIDGGLKVKIDGGMWSAPLGKVRES